MGLTQPREVQVIKLHPTLLCCADPDAPWAWGYLASHLGTAFAFDTIVHECIHLAIDQRHGGWGGKGAESSHNNDLWVAEVNRFAPLLGLQLTAGRNKPKRVPVEGPLTARGKQPTAVKRVCEGDVPFDAVAKFPRGVRYHLVAPSWWQAKTRRQDDLLPDPPCPPFYRAALPFPHALQRGARHAEQDVRGPGPEEAQEERTARAVAALRAAKASGVTDVFSVLEAL